MNGSNGIASPALRVRYDATADAMYLRLRDGAVADTVEGEEMVYVDIDAEGRPLGIEFAVASDFLPFLARRGGEFVVPAWVGAAVGA